MIFIRKMNTFYLWDCLFEFDWKIVLWQLQKLKGVNRYIVIGMWLKLLYIIVYRSLYIDSVFLEILGVIYHL